MMYDQKHQMTQHQQRQEAKQNDTLLPLWQQRSFRTLQTVLAMPGVRLTALCCLFIVVILGTMLSALQLAGASISTGPIAGLTQFPFIQILLVIGLFCFNLYAFILRPWKKRENILPPSLPMGQVSSEVPTKNSERRQFLPAASTPEPVVIAPSGYSSAHLELVLTQTFARVLDLPREKISSDSDFFRYGGDTNALTTLLHEVKHRLRLHLEANDVFDHPVLSDLARFLTTRKPSEQESATPVVREIEREQT